MSTAVLPRSVEGRSLRAVRRDLLLLLRSDPLVVVDASRVEHLSAAGAALLVAVHQSARRRGGRLLLQRPSPPVVAALAANGLRHLLAEAPAWALRAAPQRCPQTARAAAGGTGSGSGDGRDSVVPGSEVVVHRGPL